MSDIETHAEPVHAPYKCPACGKWADEIQLSMLNGLAILWHNHCKAIIGCQLMTMPSQARSNVIIPGGILKQ